MRQYWDGSVIQGNPDVATCSHPAAVNFLFLLGLRSESKIKGQGSLQSRENTSDKEDNTL